jgi:hypothetical protein
MCCVMGAVAAAIVACTCHMILRRYSRTTLAASCTAGLLFGLSPLAWEHAIGAEVFALNNLVCACIVFLTVSVFQAASSLDEVSIKIRKFTHAHLLVIVGSFFCGLAASNQHSSALLLIVAIPSVLAATHSLRMSVSFLFMVAAAFVLPICSYFYLVIAALQPKPGSWGDASNIYGLLTHVLRSEYGTFKLGSHPAGLFCILTMMRQIICRYDSWVRIVSRENVALHEAHLGGGRICRPPPCCSGRNICIRSGQKCTSSQAGVCSRG